MLDINDPSCWPLHRIVLDQWPRDGRQGPLECLLANQLSTFDAPSFRAVFITLSQTFRV